jgi:6-phosphogluconate dehydrogenase (decarboxylating)
MKITTTKQRTETVEMDINFPTFTKVVDIHSTKLYCIKSEDDITRVEKYNSGRITTIINKYYGVQDAFAEGFEYVSQDEFMQYYLDTIDKLYADLSVMKAMLTKPEKFMLQDFIDEMAEYEETRKQDEEGFEYDPETQSMVR